MKVKNTMINWSQLTESKKRSSDRKPCGNVIAEYKCFVAQLILVN